MVALAAFQSLLRRYTMQESILVGTPVAARNELEIENVIGLLVNTLVLGGLTSAKTSASAIWSASGGAFAQKPTCIRTFPLRSWWKSWFRSVW